MIVRICVLSGAGRMERVRPGLFFAHQLFTFLPQTCSQSVKIVDATIIATSTTRSVVSFRTQQDGSTGPSWVPDVAPAKDLAAFAVEIRDNSTTGMISRVFGTTYSPVSVVDPADMPTEAATHLWQPLQVASVRTRGASDALLGVFVPPMRQCKDGTFSFTIKGLSPNSEYALRILPLSTAEVDAIKAAFQEAAASSPEKLSQCAVSLLKTPPSWPASPDLSISTPSTRQAAITAIEAALSDKAPSDSFWSYFESSSPSKPVAAADSATSAATGSATARGKASLRKTAAAHSAEAVLAHERRELAEAGGSAAASTTVSASKIEVISATDTTITLSVVFRASSDPDGEASTSAAVLASAVGGFQVHVSPSSLLSDMHASTGLSERIWEPATLLVNESRFVPLPFAMKSSLAGTYVVMPRARSKRVFELELEGLKPGQAYHVRLQPLSPEEAEEAEGKGEITCGWPAAPLAYAQTKPAPATT